MLTLTRWHSVQADDAQEALSRLAVVSAYHVGEAVYYEHAPANFYYRIIDGAARKCVIASNGRRRVIDFLMPGDFFGFGAPSEALYSVEVLCEHTLVARYPRARLEQLALRNALINRAIREGILDSLARLQRRVSFLGSATALEKVNAFLFEMAERSVAELSCDLVLPMSRYDIADYLGVAVETVSRSLTELRRRQVIRIDGAARRVHFVGQRPLSACAERNSVPGHGSTAAVERRRRATDEAEPQIPSASTGPGACQ